MEFSVGCKELGEELSMVQGVVERRHALPVLSNILVTAKKGKVSFFATDLEVGYVGEMDADVRKEGQALVPFKTLADAVSVATEGEAKFKKSDKGDTKVSFENGASYRLPGAEVSDFPEAPSAADEGDKIEVDGEAFQQMLKLTSYASSREMSRYAINGVLTVFQKDALRTVATDGYRLAIADKSGCVKGVKEKFEVILPQKGIREIEKLIARDKDKKIKVARKGQEGLILRVGKRILTTRLLNDSFPNYERVIPKDNDKIVRFGKEHLVRGIKAAAVVAGDGTRPVRFEFGRNQLVIISENPDMGEAKCEISISYTGEEFKIGFKPNHLLDFLSAVPSDDVVFSLKGETDQTLLEPAASDSDKSGISLKYVVMPMRL